MRTFSHLLQLCMFVCYGDFASIEQSARQLAREISNPCMLQSHCNKSIFIYCSFQDGDSVEDLYVDLTDGTKLLTLLRLFTGVKLVRLVVHSAWHAHVMKPFHWYSSLYMFSYHFLVPAL